MINASKGDVQKHSIASRGLQTIGFPSVLKDVLTSTGTPVIAYKDGGALDYVNEKTGIFFEKQTVESLKDALRQFDLKTYSPQDIKMAAEKFSIENFHKNILAEIKKVLQ